MRRIKAPRARVRLDRARTSNGKSSHRGGERPKPARRAAVSERTAERQGSGTARAAGGRAAETRRARWVEPALEAALEALGTPAFVLDADGNVVFANDKGRELLEGEGPVAVVRAIKRARRAPEASPFTVTELPRDGAGHLLAIRRPDAPTLEERLEKAGARYGLTPAQTRVLALISRGMPNRGIADALGISERTVEAHVTAVLEKLFVESRAAAVARALAEDGEEPH